MAIENLDYTAIVGVLIVSILSDILWAYYIKKVQGNKILSASLCSAATIIASWIGGYFIVRDLFLVFIAGVGAFIGTFIVLKFDQK